MPKLWNETVEAHRRDVREAILETTVALVEEKGLLSVTMSTIAEETGIGRATLYKYFPDVATILQTWHRRQIEHHLGRLAEVRDRTEDSGQRLRDVLETYALLLHESRRHHGSEIATVLHQGEDVSRARREVRRMITQLIAAASSKNLVRTDVAPGELAIFSLHALAASSALPSKAAVGRLVELTLTALDAD